MRPLLLAFFMAPLLSVPAAAQAPTDDHTLTVTAAPASAGKPGDLAVTITPKGNWKWNPEYPARLEVELPAAATIAKQTFKGLDGDFRADGKTMIAQTTWQAAAGTHKATIKGRFGLCDAHVCIIKRVDTTATLEVR